MSDSVISKNKIGKFFVGLVFGNLNMVIRDDTNEVSLFIFKFVKDTTLCLK
jgi:hypothetical protein